MKENFSRLTFKKNKFMTEFEFTKIWMAGNHSTVTEGQEIFLFPIHIPLIFGRRCNRCF